MPQFRATFRKLVYGNTGHGREICQRVVDVEAPDRNSASEAAVDLFCNLESTMHWLNHADRMEIVEIDQTPDLQRLGRAAHSP